MNLHEAIEYVNPSVRDLTAYHLTAEDVPVKLNQNENPFDWPESIKREVAEFCVTRPWNRYPDFIPAEIKEACARYAGVTAEHIIVGNGSNEMVLTLMLAVGSRRRGVIICQPCFTVYGLLARGLSLPVHTVFMREDLSYDAATLCTAARANEGSLLILCSPNNPTGAALTEADIRTILDSHRGLFLLDQAYVEFGGFNALPLITEHPNLVITRTFSKAASGAGLRLGYMIGTPELIREINKVKLPYNINFFSAHMAGVLLSHRHIIEERVRFIKNQRTDLLRFLQSLPLKNVYPSAANFILIRAEKKDDLFAFLRRRGILVRDVSNYPMLQHCLRISCGSDGEQNLLKQALTDFFDRTLNKGA